MIKLLRTIRFDETDPRVFEHAAEPGEWACSGAFAFAGHCRRFAGKARQAFANGFLGLASFGRATFATVGEATAEEREVIELTLAPTSSRLWRAEYRGRPAGRARGDRLRRRSLPRRADQHGLHRAPQRDEAGAIKEEFRQIRPPAGEAAHARVWTIEREPGDSDSGDSEPGDHEVGNREVGDGA